MIISYYYWKKKKLELLLVSHWAGLMVMNSFRFCFLRKVSIFISEREFCWVKYSCLVGFVFVFSFPTHWIYHLLSFGQQGFSWEIHWLTWVGFIICENLIFLFLFLNLSLSSTLDCFIIMYILEKIFWIEIWGLPVSFMNLGIQISIQIWKVLSHYFF